MSSAEKENDPRPRGTVLVVDDEEKNRKLLRRILEGKEYTVLEAADGEELLQMVAASPPDTILLDVMMPKIDGFEACRRLKAVPETAHIPILMVTMLSGREDRLTGIAAGADDFLSKPVDMEEVLLRVRNAVSLKLLFDENKEFQENLEKKVAEQTQELSEAHALLSRKVQELEARDRLTNFMMAGPSRGEADQEILEVLSLLCGFSSAMILRFETEAAGKVSVDKAVRRSSDGRLQTTEKMWKDVAGADQDVILRTAELRQIITEKKQGTAFPVSYDNELLAVVWMEGGLEGLAENIFPRMLKEIEAAIALVLRGAQLNDDLTMEKIDLDGLINFSGLD